MNATAELKSYLHQLVVETNDLNILEQVKEIFQLLRQSSEKYPVSEEHKQLVLNRLNQIKTGQVKTVSWDSVKKEIEDKHGL